MLLIAAVLIVLALALALRSALRSEAKLRAVERSLEPRTRLHDGNTMPDVLPQVVPTDPGAGPDEAA